MLLQCCCSSAEVLLQFCTAAVLLLQCCCSCCNAALLQCCCSAATVLLLFQLQVHRCRACCICSRSSRLSIVDIDAEWIKRINHTCCQAVKRSNSANQLRLSSGRQLELRWIWSNGQTVKRSNRQTYSMANWSNHQTIKRSNRQMVKHSQSILDVEGEFYL